MPRYEPSFASRSRRAIASCLLLLSAACGQTQVPGSAAYFSPAGAGAGGAQAGAGGKPAANNGKPRPSSVDDESEDQDAGVSTDGATKPRPSGGKSLKNDGESCTRNADCASDHCDNELCCADGACCSEDTDCASGSSGVGNVCDYHATCQGSRGKVACNDFRCSVKDGAPNDTKCDEDVEASDCGPYKAVYCTGESEQEPPKCAQSCSSDKDCDSNAHCVQKACVLDAPEVAKCDSDAMCAKGERCKNGACEGTDPDAASSCKEALGNDKCSECACSKCEASASDCWLSDDPQRNKLCSDVFACALPASCINPLECVPGTGGSAPGGGAGGRSGSQPPGGAAPDLARGCFLSECYCSREGDCYVSPNGPCVRELRAAAGNPTMYIDISSRRSNASYAAYFAEQHAICLQRNCRSECGL